MFVTKSGRPQLPQQPPSREGRAVASAGRAVAPTGRAVASAFDARREAGNRSNSSIRSRDGTKIKSDKEY